LPETAPLADPRVFPDVASASEPARAIYELAERALSADIGQQADAHERELRTRLVALLLRGSGRELDRLFDEAPSISVTRHIWRALDAAWREAMRADASASLEVTVFALPIALVVGREGGEGGVLPGVLERVDTLATILRDHGALAGNANFALSDALIAAEAIDVARLPEILAWCRLPDTFHAGSPLPPRVLSPAPIVFSAGVEAVHLRFIAGVAIAKAGADLTADVRVGKWGIPLTRELTAQLSSAGTSLLALPRAPRRLLPAVAEGRTAARDVAAQIFASNALRRFRGAVGEPSAVISAHRAPDAPGGGELRLSLSSPLETRAAEGFRCPLFPIERVNDVGAMLATLLRDCRVTDIRMLDGVHADCGEGGATLLFKPETIADAAKLRVH
jgi:hypothetical protein